MSKRYIAALASLMLLTAVACSDTTGLADTNATLASGTGSAGSGSPAGSGSAGAGSGNSDNRVLIRLSGSSAFPNADGKAKFRDRGGERELQIEVEDGPANTAVVFMLDGAAIGSATTDAFGDAEINLNSDLGDTVPASVAGQSVAVRTAGGTLIASGSF